MKIVLGVSNESDVVSILYIPGVSNVGIHALGHMRQIVYSSLGFVHMSSGTVSGLDGAMGMTKDGLPQIHQSNIIYGAI